MTDTVSGVPMALQCSIVSVLSLTILGALVLAVRPESFYLLVRVWSQFRAHEFWFRIWRVLLLCTIFMIVGPLLMVLNKEILQTLHFDFPLTLSGLGLMTTGIVVRICVHCGVGEVRPETHQAVAGNAWFWTVFPIALAKAATLACGNAVYLHLGLGFIQMLKALNPVIVVIVMRLCGLALPCRLARWGVYLIISGTLLEVKGELNVTLVGVVLMLTSEVMEAINLVLTQKLLQNCQFTLTEGLYMTTPPSGIVLFSAAALMEWPRMIETGSYRIIFANPSYFASSCTLGLAVNFVGMAVVQATSSLTTKVLNTVRGIGVVFVGILFYGEVCSPLEFCGYAVAVIGFGLYNCAQYITDKTKKEELSEDMLERR